MSTRSRLTSRPLLIGVGAVIAIAGAALAAAVVAAVGYLSLNSHQSVTLPAPSGSYLVGRVVEDWVDRARRDPLAPSPARRELSVWIWYPAPHGATGHPAAYLPAPWQRHFRLGPIQSLMRTSPKLIHPHAREGVPLAHGRFPVLVFDPGLGLAAYDYTTIAEDLASHGYVVAGINPTYSTNVVLSGGRFIRSTPQGTADDGNDPVEARRLASLWAADLRFVARRLLALAAGHGPFAGHLMTQRVGFFGHSLGGAAAAAACRGDGGCAGAADVDGNLVGEVVRHGIGTPFLFLGHQGTLQDPGTRPQLRGTLRNVPPSLGHVLIVRGTEHQNFTDRAVYFWALMRPLGVLGPIDGRRGLTITNRYLRAFFDAHLKGVPSSLLTGPSRAYPEVRFERP